MDGTTSRRRRVAVLAAAAAVAALVALPAQPAAAGASVGASSACDYDKHCVVGYAQGTGAGTTKTGGYFVATCLGAGDGAVAITVTCSAGGVSRTRTTPGTAGAAEVIVPIDSFDPVRVCWTVTGKFPTLSGDHTVTTSSCALLTV